MQADYDYCVVGGGIVGLSTALTLAQREPDARILLLEKESGLARHQTSHNSGVIHAGIYYAPGSLKARLCREGAEATVEFCRRYDIPFERCGKLLVATNEVERQRMEALAGRAAENGIEIEHLDAAALRQAEPSIAGLAALFVKATGIVSYARICEQMARLFQARGGQIATGVKVDGLAEDADGVNISAGRRSWRASYLIVCAGLQADRMARLAGLPVDFRIVPFRGEYYRLPDSKRDIVRHLIYPIPDPDLPFLGVHLTRMIDGSVTVGPNAVLGFAREGYPRFSVDPRDLADYLRFPGFWRTSLRHFKSGMAEMRNSLFKRGYLEACRKYCPSLTLEDLLPYEAGIRAQAVLRDGTLVHDFLFEQTARSLHVCNAPSPAATSALPIAGMIADRVQAAQTAQA